MNLLLQLIEKNIIYYYIIYLQRVIRPGLYVVYYNIYAFDSIFVHNGSNNYLYCAYFSDRSYFQYYNDPRSYPLTCWLPFELNENWMFLVVFVCQSVALVFIVNVYLGIDTYFFGAIYAIGGQIELLNTSLNNDEIILALCKYL